MLSTTAFTIAGRSKERIRSNFIDAVVIHRQGSVQRIKDIEFIGWWGENPFLRLLNSISGFRRIRVDLVSLPSFRLNDLKMVVTQAVPADLNSPDPVFRSERSIGEILSLVADATTFATVFDAIGVPAPEDALDILC